MNTGFCPQCGSSRQGGLRFCANCAFDFQAAARPPSPEPQLPASADRPLPDSESSRVPVASIVALLIGAAGVAAFVWIVILNGGAASPGQSPSPEVTNTPRPTSTPRPTPLPVVGNGEITFGGDLNEETLAIIDPKTNFMIGEEIAWRAELIGPAGATSLDLVLAKVNPGGAETVVYTDAVPVSNPEFDLLGNKVDLSPLLDGAGTYVMRYFRESTQLAEGQFTLR